MTLTECRTTNNALSLELLKALSFFTCNFLQADFINYDQRHCMNSPFSNVFLAIQSLIQTTVPAITYIDQDLGQLKSTTRPPVSWPCALIDFEDFKFENLGENVQTATGTVVIQLGFAPFSNTSQATPTDYKQQALNYYELEFSLHQQLQGWSPTDMSGSLIRTSVATQRRNDHYRVRELRYSLAFEDYSTKNEEQMAPATIVVMDEIVL